MSYASEHPEKCLQPGCPRTVRGSRHHRIDAQREGWFFPRDGGAWCPDHKPAWVDAWRARKASGS